MSVAEMYAALAGPIPAPRQEATAGTCGDGYMTTARPHGFTAEAPEYGRRPLCAVFRSGLDEASIFAAQARWEQVDSERQAQIAAMEWALGQPEAWSLVERFAAEQVAAALRDAADDAHHGFIDSRSDEGEQWARWLRARAAAVLAADNDRSGK